MLKFKNQVMLFMNSFNSIYSIGSMSFILLIANRRLCAIRWDFMNIPSTGIHVHEWSSSIASDY